MANALKAQVKVKGHVGTASLNTGLPSSRSPHAAADGDQKVALRPPEQETMPGEFLSVKRFLSTKVLEPRSFARRPGSPVGTEPLRCSQRGLR